MYIQQFFVDGLGCASYLVGCEAAGVAAVVDPERDVSRYLEAAAKRNLKITHILETHLHADHVSGNTDLAARTGATIYLPARAGATFPHTPLHDGDRLRLGNVQIEARHTPGHTPESMTLLVTDTMRADEPWMAFTGDVLFVGDVGRPDLVSADAAEALAADLHESLFEKLLTMDDGLLVYPGHGAGSLCGRAIGSVPYTTLGFERRHNPALAVADKREFVSYMTSNLPEQPGNHRPIKAMNRRGPQPLGEITPKALTLEEAIPYFENGAALLDTRPKADFVQSHVPGSTHLPADSQLSSRAGFVLPPDAPLVLLVSDEATYRQAVLALARVGYENVAGYLAGGMAAWETAGLPVASGDVEDITPEDLQAMRTNGNRPVILDVREPWEYAQGHIPGALLIPLGQLAVRLGELDPTRPVATICHKGVRSQSAATLLGQRGFAKVYNVLGGMDGWQAAGLETE